jgi:hypothetical protein
MADPNFLFATKHRIAEVQLQIQPQVVAAYWATTAAAPPLGTLSTAKAPKKALKDVGKAAHVAHVAVAAARCAADPGFPEPIVASAGFGFGQDFVGLTDLLEGFLGSGFFVHIRVILPGHAPVGPLQFFFVRVPSNAQSLVVISHNLMGEVYVEMSDQPPRPGTCLANGGFKADNRLTYPAALSKG